MLLALLFRIGTCQTRVSRFQDGLASYKRVVALRVTQIPPEPGALQKHAFGADGVLPNILDTRVLRTLVSSGLEVP